METIRLLLEQEKELMRLLEEVREQILQEQKTHYWVYCQHGDTELEAEK